MKGVFWIVCFGIAAFLQSFGPEMPKPGVEDLLSREQYQKLFPHRHSIYTYESFLEAAKNFPLFASEGGQLNCKRELIGFFANIAHETANSRDNNYEWGLFYTEEQACKDGHCTQYNVAGYSEFQPAPGKSYHGRGPIQLSYAYNYGLAGKELGLPLLEKPELVSTDAVTGFKTALWFWMRPQKPKPSCHEVMCGKWQPSKADSLLRRKPGFGMTINIINGGVECNSEDPAIQHEQEERIGFYKWFAKIMSVPPEDQCDCKGMGAY